MNDLERAIDEFLELTEPVPPPFTLESIARGSNGKLHERQLAYMRSLARWIMLMCSRRAGKTFGIAGRYARRSTAKPNGNRAYIALTKDQARSIMWEPIWKPLCQRWSLCGPDAHNETRMVTTFGNGSVVRFTGSDDIKHIATELGAALDEATIDESQDQPPHVLKTLADKILPPALGDRRGTLCISGVIPDVRVGYFWDTWKGKTWENHNWSMFDNPHFLNPQEIVDEYIAKHPGMTLRSPIILRDYYGDDSDDAFDANATAYQYEPALNGYQPEIPEWLARVYETQKDAGRDLKFAHPMQEDPADGALYGMMAAVPMPGIRYFGLALDPGSNSDRASIQGMGWGEATPIVQHVVDWTTPRGARLTTGQMFAVLGLFYRVLTVAAGPRGGVVRCRYDAGSSQNTIDNLQGDYKIPLVLAAKKSDLSGQIERNRDLLTQGKEKVMFGSSLEQDYKFARRDPNQPTGAPWKWSPQWHPDPSEAGRYAIQDYFDVYEAPPPPPTDELERHREEVRRMLAEAKKDEPEDDQADYGDLG